MSMLRTPYGGGRSPGPQPQLSGGGLSVTAAAREEQRKEREVADQHQQLKTELEFLAAKQKQRIEKLKLDSAVQIEHHSTLRRLELERRRSAAMEGISNITPRLEVVRSQWSHTKQQNQGFEMQWGSLRQQYQSVKGKIDLLKDSIEDGKRTMEDTKDAITRMREQTHSLDRDKAALRGKIKRGLECLVIDDNFLTNRVREEETYYNQLRQALAAMEAEYQDGQAQYQHEFAPLEEDVRALSRYLEEMQNRSQELQHHCVELEGKAQSIEDHWVESVHAVYEGLERANHLDILRNTALAFLERQINEHKAANIKPRVRTGQMDPFWLTSAVTVWDALVREMKQEKSNMQVRDDSAQLLADTSQKTQATKNMVAAMKRKVEGTDAGTHRLEVLSSIVDMHHLMKEKRDTEDELIKYVQEIATTLDEDLALVLQLVRKDGYDDYVSSTDEDEAEELSTEEAAGVTSLQEEPNNDIAQIVSSSQLDPDDPASMEMIKRMSRRKEGPLREFAIRRAQYLQSSTAQRGVGGPSRKERAKKMHTPTLERALMDVQVQGAGEVVAYVKKRQQAIQNGTLDPRQERLVADKSYVLRARDTTNRIERWVAAQKEAPGNKGSTRGGGEGGVRAVGIPGAREPPEIANANPVAKAAYYLGRAVQGAPLMLYLQAASGPQLRQVYLSRDMTTVVARSPHSAEELRMRVTEITDVVLGHKTPLMASVASKSRAPLREELAFSLVTATGTTLDMECETVEQRNYWAQTFAWIVNESRPAGTVATLLRSDKISVVNTRDPLMDPIQEPVDRTGLEIQLR